MPRKGYWAITKELEGKGVEKTIGRMAKQKPGKPGSAKKEKKRESLIKKVERRLRKFRKLLSGKKTHNKEPIYRLPKPTGKRT